MVRELGEIIELDEQLRLRKPYQAEWSKAIPWYQDQEILKMSEGINDRIYTMEDVQKMYFYLIMNGNLFFIEAKDYNSDWVVIGDAVFSEENLPIVIGNKAYWGRGIGKRVIEKFIELAISLNLQELNVPEIYHYNERSINLFTGLGFLPVKRGEKSSSYKLALL